MALCVTARPSSRKRPYPAPSDQERSDYDCAICQELLVEPVTGICGHQFCKFCLEKWRAANASQASNVVRCPQCRGMLCPTSYRSFGVSRLLERMLQNMFPEEYQRRLNEVRSQQQQEGQALRRMVDEQVSAIELLMDSSLPALRHALQASQRAALSQAQERERMHLAQAHALPPFPSSHHTADPYAHSAAAHNVSPPLPNQLSMHAPATHSSGSLGAPPHPLSTAGHQMRAYAALGNGALPGAAGALAHMSAMPAISSMSSVFSPGGSYMAASGSTVVAQARMNPLFRPGGPIFGPMPTTTTTTTTTTTRQRIRRPSNRNPLAPLISPPQPTVEPFSSSVQYHSLRSVQPVCKEPYGLRPHDGCENSLGSQGVAHRGVKHVGSVPSALVGAGLCHSGEQPDSSTTRAHLAHHAASSQDRGIDCHAPEPGHDGSVDSADRVDMGQGNERLHDPHDPHSVQDPDAVTLLADETELDGCGAADEAHAAGGAAEPASPAAADAPALQLWQEQAGSSFPSPLADAPSPVASWFGAGRRGVTAAAAVAVAGAGAAAATPVRPAAPAAVLPVLSPVVPGSAAGLSLAARAAHAAGPAAPSPPPFRLDSCAPQGPAAAAAVAQGGEALWGVGVSHGQGESDVGRVTAPVWDEDDTSPHDVTVEALEQRFAAARSSARTGGGGSASGWQAFVTNHAHRCSPPPKDRARPALRLAASPVRPPRNGEHLPTTTHHQDAVIEGAAHDNDTWDGMRDDAGAQGPHSAAQSHSSAQAMADSAQGSDTSADGSPGRYAPSKDPWFTQHQYTHTLTGPAADEHMDETDGCEKPLVQCECETPRASVTGPLGGGMGLGVGVGDNDAGSTGQSVRGKSRVREPLPSPQGRLNLAGTDTHAEADTHTVRSAQGSDTPGMAGTDAVADLDAAGPSEPVSVAQRDGACRLVKVEEGLASQYEHGSYPVRVAHSSVAQQGTVAAALQRGSEAMQRVPAAASSPVTMPMATPGASMPALSTHLQPSPAADSDHAHAASPAHSGDAGLAGGGGVGWPTSPGDGLHVRILPPGMSGRSLPPSAAAAAASMSAPVVFVSLPPDGPWQNPDRDRRMRETAVRRLVEELLSRVPNLLRPERAVSFQQCISKIEECLYLNARSAAEYSDPSTLVNRFLVLRKQILEAQGRRAAAAAARPLASV